MTLVFDTSTLSELLKDNDRIVTLINETPYSLMLVPLATDTELRFGFSYGSRQDKNLELYDSFKQHFRLSLHLPDQDTSIIYSDLATWCRKNGVSLSNNDLWIAATTVQSGGQLLTLDKDFAHLPQVSLAGLN